MRLKLLQICRAMDSIVIRQARIRLFILHIILYPMILTLYITGSTYFGVFNYINNVLRFLPPTDASSLKSQPGLINKGSAIAIKQLITHSMLHLVLLTNYLMTVLSK